VTKPQKGPIPTKKTGGEKTAGAASNEATTQGWFRAQMPQREILTEQGGKNGRGVKMVNAVQSPASVGGVGDRKVTAPDGKGAIQNRAGKVPEGGETAKNSRGKW